MTRVKQPEENVNAGSFPWLALQDIIEAIPSHRQKDVKRILSSQANGLGNGGEFKKTRAVISLFIEEYRDDHNGNNICLLINCVLFCFKNRFYQEAREALGKFVKLNWHSTRHTQYFEKATVSTTNGLGTKDPFCFSETLFVDNLSLVKPNAANHSFVLLNEMAKIAIALCECRIAKIILDHLEEDYGTNHSQRETEIAVVKCNVGCLYAFLGQYDKALEYLMKSKTFLNRDKEPYCIAAIYNNVGWIYQKLGSYKKAELSFKECLSVFQHDAEPTIATVIVTTKYSLAISLKQQGRFEDAMQELREARAICNDTVPLPLQGVLALELLPLSLSEGESEESVQLDIFCREICSTIMNKDSGISVDEATGAFQERFAEACLQRGEINEAKEILLSICNLFQTLHGQDHPYLISLLFKLGCVYFIEQEYKRCTEMIEKAEKIAIETYGASNPKLLPIYSKLAELQFYHFNHKHLAKQCVEKVMDVLCCMRENGGSLLSIHLDHLKNTGILDSCVYLTVSGSCIVLHLCRRKLFEETRSGTVDIQGGYSSVEDSASVSSVLGNTDYCQESELCEQQPIELSFYCDNNRTRVTSLVALAIGLLELGKSDTAATALKYGLKQKTFFEKGILHLLLRSGLTLIQAFVSCQDSTNTKAFEVSKEAILISKRIQREMELLQFRDRGISREEKFSSCVAALVTLCNTFSVLNGVKENKELLQAYRMLSKLLQQRQSNRIGDHYWFDTLGHMIYYASEDICATNGTVSCDFIVMESYPHLVAHDPSQVSQQNIRVIAVEDDGLKRRLNVIVSSAKPVEINNLKILKNKTFKHIKQTLEMMEFTEQGSAVVIINLKVEPESIPKLCYELEHLPLLVYASKKPRFFESAELTENRVTKGVHGVLCKGLVHYLSQGEFPDSFLHKLLVTCLKEQKLLGDFCDFAEGKESISLLSIKPRMTHISVSCKQGFLEVKINSLCLHSSDSSACDCALNIRHFNTVVEKIAHSYGIQLEQGYSETSCRQTEDCCKPIRRACAVQHKTVGQRKFGVIRDGKQQHEPSEFVDVDFACLSVDAHQRPISSGQSETPLDGNVLGKISGTIERSEESATNYSCITHDEEVERPPRMDVGTQTEVPGIPPCLEKKSFQRVPERKHCWLHNNESDREANSEVKFEQGIPVVYQQSDGAVGIVSNGHMLQLQNTTSGTPLSPDQHSLLRDKSAHGQKNNDCISREDEKQTSLNNDEIEYSVTGVTSRSKAGRLGCSSAFSLLEEEDVSIAGKKNKNESSNSRSSDANVTLYHTDILDMFHTIPSGIRGILQRAVQQTCDETQREAQQWKEEKANVESLLGEALFERDQAVRHLRRQQQFEQIRRRQTTAAETDVTVNLVSERQKNEDPRLSDADRQGVGRNLSTEEAARKLEKRLTVDYGVEAQVKEQNEETKPRKNSSNSKSSGDSSHTFGEDEPFPKTRYTLRQVTDRSSLINKSFKTSSDCNKVDAAFNAKQPSDPMRHSTPDKDHQENQECNSSEAEAYRNRLSLIEDETEEQTDSGLEALLEMSDDCNRRKPDQTLQATSGEDGACFIVDKNIGLTSTDTEKQSMETKVEVHDTGSESESRGRVEESNVLPQSYRLESSDIPETNTSLNTDDSSENGATGIVSVANAMQMTQNGTSSLGRTTLTDTKNTETAFESFEDDQGIGEDQNRETNDKKEPYHTVKADSTATFSSTTANMPLRTWNRVESSIQRPGEVVTGALRSRSVYLEQGARPKQIPTRTVSIQRSREKEEAFVSDSPTNDGLDVGFLTRHTRDASIHEYASHINRDAARLTLPHEHGRVSTADVDSELNVDLEDSFVLAAYSKNQPMSVPSSGTVSSDYPSQLMGPPAAYSPFAGYNVGSSYFDVVPPPPFIGALPNIQTSPILIPTSSVVSSSSGDRNFGNNGSFDGVLTIASNQTNHVGQDSEKESESGGKTKESVSCEETVNDTEDVSNADEIEIAELANLSISSTESFRSEEERVNTLEARVAEACAMVKQVFRERRAREQEIQEREQRQREERERALIDNERSRRQEQERIARDREERESSFEEQGGRQRNGESRPEGAAAETTGEVPSVDDEKYPVQESPQWLCEHYQRRCNLRFPCCNVYYPCHRCHNSSDRCTNESAKAHEASHLQCIVCRAEQPVTESYDTQTCQSCGTKLSEYFCPKCKHFTGVEKKPYHCDKCGICRIHRDRSFHCEVCNVCLDKRLEGKHKCRPDSGHDECCICLEDAFSGCQILPCSHKVHRDCAIAMVRNGIRTCPVCRHPLYDE